jgi:hypothetical protein
MLEEVEAVEEDFDEDFDEDIESEEEEDADVEEEEIVGDIVERLALFHYFIYHRHIFIVNIILQILRF